MDQSEQSRFPLLVRWPQQKFVASLVAAALVGIAAYWIFVQRPHGGWIDIETAPRVTVAYMVDINSANWPQFAQLPGVGETLARRIVASRDSDGPFASHEDLGRVSGIGPKTISAIRRYLLPFPDTNVTAEQ